MALFSPELMQQGFCWCLLWGPKEGECRLKKKNPKHYVMFDHVESKVVWVGPRWSKLRVLSASDRYLTWVL